MILPLTTIANFVLVFLVQGNHDFTEFEIKQNRTHVYIILKKHETYNYKYREAIKIENERGLVRMQGYKF